MARTYLSARVGPVGVTQGVGVPWGLLPVIAYVLAVPVLLALALLALPVIVAGCLLWVLPGWVRDRRAVQ